ncbi:MAG: DUF1295 domain-containing protein [Candidatus Peribacteria bacterium]|nr:MAG: DUF1295 domain-containing protein [Candidatus Peribacteria bacterium]
MAMGRDRRFDGMREYWWKFLKFRLLQTCAIWIILLPVMLMLLFATTEYWGFWFRVGLLVWL